MPYVAEDALFDESPRPGAVGRQRRGNRLVAPELRQGRGDEIAMLRLQQRAGNRAVSTLVQRRSTTPSALHGAARIPDLQRADGDGSGADCFVALPPQLEDGGQGPSVGEEVASAETGAVAAAAGAGISAPTPVSWAALNDVEGDGASAIPGPSTATLAAIQAAAGGGTGIVGWTSFPMATAQAPQFDMGTTSSTPGGMGPPSFSSAPIWKQHFNEGNSVCMYLAAGRHPTALVEAGKPVFFNVSAAISTRDGQAEGEHSNDIKRARDISIKEAETVLTNHVVGKTFPASASLADAEQKVLDKITSKLTHAGLGNDQAKWAGIYETLYRKTLGRDNKGWHTFGLGNRKVNAAGDVDYTLNNHTTSINTTSSNSLIVY